MHGLLSRTVQIRSLDGPRPHAIEEPSHAHHHAGEDEKQDHACSDRVVRPSARWIGNNQSGPRNGRKQELDQGHRQHQRDIHPVHDHPCLILPRVPMHSAPQPTASFHLCCTKCNPADDAHEKEQREWSRQILNPLSSRPSIMRVQHVQVILDPPPKLHLWLTPS